MESSRLKVNRREQRTASAALDDQLSERLGRVHAQQRLCIERAFEAQVFGRGINFFHIENWYSAPSLIRNVLRLCGVWWIGQRNARRVRVRHMQMHSPRLPPDFDGFTILQVSDLHVELSEAAIHRAQTLIEGLEYDVCVLTGDYRALTFGPCEAAVSGVLDLCSQITQPIFGVLGNHDSIRMVPDLERNGVRMLLNETETIERGGARIYLAGIDDAHYYRVDNIERAASAIPAGSFSVLLSHTPEIYRQAAHAGFDLMLSGHTHGGQICLLGGVALKLNARLPRRMGRGAWSYGEMHGYTSTGVGTSIVTARFNCPPEITLHHLHAVQV